MLCILLYTAILQSLGSKDNPSLPVGVPANLALSLARIVEDSMGGSSGAVCCVIAQWKAFYCLFKQ